jgi:hypothetical protein
MEVGQDVRSLRGRIRTGRSIGFLNRVWSVLFGSRGLSVKFDSFNSLKTMSALSIFQGA